MTPHEDVREMGLVLTENGVGQLQHVLVSAYLVSVYAVIAYLYNFIYIYMHDCTNNVP